MISRDEPLGTVPGKPPLYRVADSNLRLYLAMLRTAQEHGRRGHPETAVRLVLGQLVAGARQVPGLEPGATGLAVVSLSGVTPGTGSVGLVWSARDVLSAWAP